MTRPHYVEYGTRHRVSEAEFQQQVEDIAALRGWLKYHTRRSKGSEPGFPDLVLIRGDRLVVAELKKDAAAGPTPDQQKWLEAFAGTGAETYVWRPRDIRQVAARLA